MHSYKDKLKCAFKKTKKEKIFKRKDNNELAGRDLSNVFNRVTIQKT